MTNTSRWLYIVLISSVQLVLLLIGVILLFSWLGNSTDKMLGQQTCLDNHEVGQQIAVSIEAESIRDIRSLDAKDLPKLNAIIAATDVKIQGLIGVWDFGSGKLFGSFPAATAEFELIYDQIPLKSLTENSTLGVLKKNISNQIGQRLISASLDFQGEEYFVSARFLPALNAVLVVGKKRSVASEILNQTMQRYKAYAFAITLLIGLMGICLTVLIINKIGHSVNNVNDGLERAVSSGARELVRTKNAVIFGLAKLAESRDNDTGEHLDRIQTYVTILAKEIALNHPEFDDEFIHNLGLASSLHDIGKVGIPDSILMKPGRLTPEERGIMEIHTVIGGECLDAIHDRLGENEFMHIARQIAYHHHERWDGTGYPHSLSGTEIPLSARIVAVADVYDALTSKRPYKTAMSHLESKEIIVQGSGKHFDPEIVEAFLRHEDEFHEIALQQQSLSDEQTTSGFQRLCDAVRS